MVSYMLLVRSRHKCKSVWLGKDSGTSCTQKKHTLTSVAEVTGPHARTTQASATIFILMLVNQCLKIWFNQRWFNYQKANEIMQFAFAFYGES